MPIERIGSEHIDYLNRMGNPKTPADLLLAAQNPYSPFHKKLINQILMGEEIHYIVDLLIERFQEQEYKASQRDKEEMYLDWLAKQLASKETLKRIYAKPLDENALSALDRHAFKERLDDRASLIQQLHQEYEMLDKRYQGLQEDGEKISADWHAISKQQAENYTDILAKQEMSLLDANGEAISPESIKGKQIIHHAFRAASPVDILAKIGASYEKMGKPAEVATLESSNIPTPPPLPMLPLAFSNPAAMAGMHNVFNQIKLIAGCAGNGDKISEFLQAKRNNADACQYLPGARLALKPGSATKNTLEETPECKVFAKAINHYQQCSAVKQAILQNQQLLVKTEQQQELEIQQYKKQTGKNYPHTFSPKPGQAGD